MPTTLTSSPPRSPRKAAAPSPRLRSATFALHVAVSILAVLSLATNRFDLWVDLRRLHPLLTILLKITWVATVLVIPLAAGPRLAWRAGKWKNHPLSPALARRLLLPTYFLMACLLANTVFYYDLWWHDRIDTPYPIPTPLIVCFLLAAWSLCTREWTRTAERAPHKLPESAPASRPQRLRAAAFIAATLAFAAAVFFIHTWHKPVPPQGVDLAIVLGHRVMPDGTASVTLADRALIAADLYHRGLARHLFLSGMISPPEIEGGPERNEARAMHDVCLAAGVPEDAMTLDPVGVNTRATAFNAAQFMHARGYTSAVVCTTSFHLFRSVMACHESGFDACAEPAVRTGWICIDPRDTLRELAAIVTYTLDPNYRLPKAQTMHLTDPKVVVKKSAGTLELFDGPALVKRYACITGANPGDKEKEGDRKTPLGTFRIVFKNPQSKFHLSLGLDYPSAEDAARGLAQGLITRQQYNDIRDALHADLSQPENQKKLWYTPLGGEIFLHGHGENRAATAGCIALSNPDIEELYTLLPLQTPVEIKP